MAFGGSVGRLWGLLDDSGDKTCADTLNEIFASIAAARSDGAVAVPTKVGSFDEDEDASFLRNQKSKSTFSNNVRNSRSKLEHREYEYLY